MSLNVYLEGKKKKVMCYACGREHKEREEIYSRNITHNLGKMASEAGIYEILWRPEEVGVKTAEDIAYKLDLGIQELKRNPEKYKKFSAENGWGTYEQFIPWLEDYLEALKENPKARIRVSR